MTKNKLKKMNRAARNAYCMDAGFDPLLHGMILRGEFKDWKLRSWSSPKVPNMMIDMGYEWDDDLGEWRRD